MKTLLLFLSIFAVLAIKSQHQVGHYTKTFQDPERGNRAIETEIYYPATVAGDNTPVAAGDYPVIVFGHGFVMAWSAYENLWEEFVPRGYIMVFPRTEGSIFGTDHQKFGWDLEYLVTQMQIEGQNSSSPIYNAVDANTALMGHSMGGGAAFLAADSLCVNGNSNLKTLIGLAPAESSSNGVSSINSALSITVPSVVLSGAQDGVTPAVDHHIPMYDNLASDCKTFINVLGGAHCYFANSNTACDFGEGTSSSGISITRTEQHEVTFDFLNLWLDYTLKSDCDDFSVFQDSLNASNRVTFNQTCNYQTLSVSSSVVDATCNGATGSATLQITGGSATFTEDWGSVTNTSLAAGVHNYNVTDAKGCSVSGSVTIAEPSAITVSETLVSPSCSGLSDGSASLAISGGAPGYTEDWGSTDENALSAGGHNYTITDANGCVVAGTVTLVAAASIAVIETIVAPTCNGLSDGSVSLVISGGAPGYTEDWGSADVNALAAGTYNYTVIDDNGCSISGDALVTEPTIISAVETVVAPSCNGLVDGSVSLVISGGTPGYTESWGSTNPNAIGAGTYNYTIEDDHACSYSFSVIVSQPSAIAMNEVVVRPSCFGGSDGSVVVNSSGGTGTLIEDWSGKNPLSMAAGTFPVTITDANGCSVTNAITITEPSVIDVSASLTAVSCFGLSDGVVALTITGGTPGYTEDWGVLLANGLPVGTHAVTVTDANGCIVTEDFTIVGPSEMSITSVVTDPSCYGGANGTVSLNVSGGVPGYSENWGGENPNALPVGTHTVVISDATGCSKMVDFTLNQPSELLVNSTTQNPACFGDDNGSAVLVITGGTPSYLEDWGVNNPNELMAGNYIVQVTDASGCVLNHGVTITNPSQINISSSFESPNCFGDQDGSISLNVSGGTPGYVENWSGVDPLNIGAGIYTVDVLDAEGCMESHSITVTEPSALTISLNTTHEIVGADGEVAIAVTGGTPAYEYSINSGAFVSGSVFTGLNDGVYTVLVQDANGCSISATSTVNEPSSVGMSEEYLTGVKVYPVPMIDNLLVDFSNSRNQDQVTLVLVNVLGEVMYEYTIDNTNAIYTVDVAMYPSGTYFLTLQSNERFRTIKLVK